MTSILREIANIVSQGKLYAIFSILFFSLGAGLLFSDLGYPEFGLSPAFPGLVFGVIYAIKREMGIFGGLIDLD
jgi:hypothetical protein